MPEVLHGSRPVSAWARGNDEQGALKEVRKASAVWKKFREKSPKGFADSADAFSLALPAEGGSY